jgi:VanZ family protein
MNRWVHFLAYLTVVALPFAAWKGRIGVFISLMVAAMGLSLEIAQVFVAGLSEVSQDVFPEMFGVVGGMLLGYNIRMLLSSVSGRSSATVGISHSSAQPTETSASLKGLPPSAS